VTKVQPFFYPVFREVSDLVLFPQVGVLTILRLYDRHRGKGTYEGIKKTRKSLASWLGLECGPQPFGTSYQSKRFARATAIGSWPRVNKVNTEK
jgi:hypothetical protein